MLPNGEIWIFEVASRIAFVATEPLCHTFSCLEINFGTKDKNFIMPSYTYYAGKEVLLCNSKYFSCFVFTLHFSDQCATLQKLLHEEPYTLEEIEKITGQSLATVFQSSQTSLDVLRAAKHFKLFQVNSTSLFCIFLHTSMKIHSHPT